MVACCCFRLNTILIKHRIAWIVVGGVLCLVYFLLVHLLRLVCFDSWWWEDWALWIFHQVVSWIVLHNILISIASSTKQSVARIIIIVLLLQLISFDYNSTFFQLRLDLFQFESFLNNIFFFSSQFTYLFLACFLNHLFSFFN